MYAQSLRVHIRVKSVRDTTIGHKFDAAAKSGLNPILCLGESLDERVSGKANKVIKRQLDAVIDIAGINSFAHAVIAYEPVWAIGGIRILYGGSVKPTNADELFAMQDIDGGLIGGASLKADDFVAIVNAAANSYSENDNY